MQERRVGRHGGGDVTGTWVRTWSAKASHRDLSWYLRAISLFLKEMSVIMSSLLPNSHVSRMIWLGGKTFVCRNVDPSACHATCRSHWPGKKKVVSLQDWLVVSKVGLVTRVGIASRDYKELWGFQAKRELFPKIRYTRCGWSPLITR